MTHLSPGEKAPPINGIDQDGKPISLDQYKGKKLILFFYPKDNTETCIKESCNLRDNYTGLKQKGFEVLGVSADNEKSHQKFIGKFSLPYRLLADTGKEVINSYGVWGPKKFMGREYDGIHRTTFVINEKGIIEEVFTKVISKTHAEQITETMGIQI